MKKLTSFFIVLGILLLIIGGCAIVSIPIANPSTPTSLPLSPTPQSSSGTGMVYGAVLDNVTNMLLSDVTIKVDGVVVYITSSDGSYEIRGLSIGTHTFSFEKAGFKTESFTLNITTSNSSIQHYVYMKRE